MIKVTLAETREFGACVSDNNEPHPRSCVPWMLASGLGSGPINFIEAFKPL